MAHHDWIPGAVGGAHSRIEAGIDGRHAHLNAAPDLGVREHVQPAAAHGVEQPGRNIGGGDPSRLNRMLKLRLGSQRRRESASADLSDQRVSCVRCR